VPNREALGRSDKALWDRNDDGEPKDPYEKIMEVVFVNYKSPELAYTFTTTSAGGLKALRILCSKYGRRMRSHPGEVPVIRLDVSSYDAAVKGGGRIKKPVFPIVEWVKEEPYLNGLDGAPGGQPPSAEMAKAIEHQREEHATKADRGRYDPLAADSVP